MEDCKIATAATDWWIDQMKKRCKELYPNKVIGDDSNLVVIDVSLDNELSRFREALFKQILLHVEVNMYLSLTCCFWPSGELRGLVRKTSISKEYFPPRANMQIYGNSVHVSLNGEDLHQLPLSAN